MDGDTYDNIQDSILWIYQTIDEWMHVCMSNWKHDIIHEYMIIWMTGYPNIWMTEPQSNWLIHPMDADNTEFIHITSEHTFENNNTSYSSWAHEMIHTMHEHKSKLKHMHVCMHICTNAQSHLWPNLQIVRHTHEVNIEGVSEWVREWVSKELNECMHDWMNVCINNSNCNASNCNEVIAEQMDIVHNEVHMNCIWLIMWITEWINEWMNEWMY